MAEIMELKENTYKIPIHIKAATHKRFLRVVGQLMVLNGKRMTEDMVLSVLLDSYQNKK